MTILVTGAAGFIGFHLSKRLLEESIPVIGFDNLNSYYDPKLKEERLNQLNIISNKVNTSFNFILGDLINQKELNSAFKKYKPDKVVNLAAQAGVRYSIENPMEYIQTNLVGFGNVLQECRNNDISHLHGPMYSVHYEAPDNTKLRKAFTNKKI